MLRISLFAILAAAASMAAPSSSAPPLDIEDLVAVIDSTVEWTHGANVTGGTAVIVPDDSGKISGGVSSRNWGGLVHESPPAGSHFHSIKGTITLQKPSNPHGSKGYHAASAWVGLDGDYKQAKAVVQAGCYTTTTSGPSCWFEWFPRLSQSIDDFNVDYGQPIEITVTGLSAHKAKVEMQNHKTGQHVMKMFDSPHPSSTLQGYSAEWIVEDFTQNGKYVPLADFKNVDFNNCDAKAGGQSVGLDGATEWDITINNNRHSKVHQQSRHQFHVAYQP